MKTVELTGLRGGNPLGFLAALGVLRICSEHLHLRNTRLLGTINHSGMPGLRLMTA